MKPVAQHAAATRELAEAAAWYEERVEGLGERLFEAFQETLLFIRQNPQLGSPHRRGTRKRRMDRFPYSVIYREEPDRVFVVAIAHGARKPGYWESRLS